MQAAVKQISKRTDPHQKSNRHNGVSAYMRSQSRRFDIVSHWTEETVQTMQNVSGHQHALMRVLTGSTAKRFAPRLNSAWRIFTRSLDASRG